LDFGEADMDDDYLDSGKLTYLRNIERLYNDSNQNEKKIISLLLSILYDIKTDLLDNKMSTATVLNAIYETIDESNRGIIWEAKLGLFEDTDLLKQEIDELEKMREKLSIDN